MSHNVSELEELLENIPHLIDGLSQDVWESIDHDDARSLQSGVTFKQQFNERANRLKTAAREFVALLDRHVEVVSDDGEGPADLRINEIQTASNLDRLEQFLSPASTSKDNR